METPQDDHKPTPEDDPDASRPLPGFQRDGGTAIRPRNLEKGSRRGVLTARIPVWAFLGTLVAIAGLFGVLLLNQARSAVELGPAVGTAEAVEVQMTLCNADVDRLGINPRSTELGLEKVLREEGARNANVVVDRQDCPKPQQ